MSVFIILWCKISSGYCAPKIIEIHTVFTDLFKMWKGGRFWDTV